MNKTLRKSILAALGTTSLAGFSPHAMAIAPPSIGTFTGTELTFNNTAPYKSWSDYGTNQNYGWTHTANFVTVQIGSDADIAAGKVLDVNVDLQRSGTSAPMDYPGFSIWTSGPAPLAGGAANGGSYGHKWNQARGPRDGGIGDEPCTDGGDCALGSNGWMGADGGGNIVAGHDGWVGYANAGYAFTNGDGDKVQGLLAGATNPSNVGQYGDGGTGSVGGPAAGAALPNVNNASPYVRGGFATLAAGDAKLTLYGLKAGYYLLGIGGVCPDEDQNGQNCGVPPAIPSKQFTLSLGSPANTAPAFVSATPAAFTMLKGSAPVDLKPYLRIADPDSNQTETWSQSAAPSQGGTLALTNAAAASGGADIAPGGALTYQPAANFVGTETFSVQADDGQGGTAVRQFAATVVEPSAGLLSGAFAEDDDAQLFSFETDGETPVTLRTWSYAAGGFDPLLTLFDAWGQIVAQVQPKGYLNDDADDGGACSKAPADPANGLCLDALYEGKLPKGKFWLALTQSYNVSNSSRITDGYTRDGQGNFSASQAGCPNPAGGFYDYACHQRSGAWSLEIAGAQKAQAESAFVAAPNQTPIFVGSNQPVTLNLPAGGPPADLRQYLHVSDSDLGQTEIWSVARAPTHGELSLSNDAIAASGGTDIAPGGAIAYTPQAGYLGPDSFEVRVSDGTGSVIRLFNAVIAETGQNFPPQANAGPDRQTNQGLAVILDGSASFDPEGTALAYRWTQKTGDPAVEFLTGKGPDTAQPQFVAPTVAADTVLSFDLVVTDAEGRASSADTATVTVWKDAKGVPHADAGADISAQGGDTVVLDGSQSVDPDPGQTETLRFQWTAPAGIALSNASDKKPSFVAPAAGEATLDFQLVVTDSDGNASAPAGVTVTAKKRNSPPEAHAAAIGGPSVRAGSVKTLDASASFDPDGDPLVYAWTAPAGVELSDAAADKPSFTAPLSAAGQTLEFRLKVGDGQAESAASLAVQATADNNAPTVEIIAQPVKEGGQTTLNSTVGDPDGDPIARYLWQQVSGAPVALSKVDGPSLSFTAPSVGTAAGQLAFSLTVTDGYAPNPKQAAAVATVQVADDPATLDCSTAAASRASLWPPNRKMAEVSVIGVSGPALDGLSITGIASDEPVKDKAAKDRTGPDAKVKRGKGFDTAKLRAERQRGNGRVYTISFTARSGGQSCDGAVKVEVPPTRDAQAVDDGQPSAQFDALKKK
jgi:hypothetical protein